MLNRVEPAVRERASVPSATPPGEVACVRVGPPPLALADLVALLAAARAARETATSVELAAGGAPAAGAVYAPPDQGLPRRISHGREVGDWLEALSLTEQIRRQAPRTAAEEVSHHVELVSPRLLPGSPGGLQAARVTVLASPARRWLSRLGLSPEMMVAEFSRRGMDGPHQLERWLLAVAEARAAEEARAAWNTLEAATQRVRAARQSWQRHIHAHGLTVRSAAAEVSRAMQVLTAQADEMTQRHRSRLRTHAVRTARHLAPWGGWQDAHLSADWLVEYLGSPQALAEALQPATVLHSATTVIWFVLD